VIVSVNVGASTSVREPISKTMSVRLNHAQCENNRSSFGTFSGPNLLLKLTSRRRPDGRNSRAGLCRPLL